MADRGMIPLRGFVIDTTSGNDTARIFLLLRDVFVLLTLLFFLLRMDDYLFRTGLLPIAPIILMFFWIISVWVLSAVSTLFERQYSLVITRSLPIIVPFVAIVGFSWVGIFLQGSAFNENYKAILLPTLDFGLFLTGVVIGAMRISEWKWSTALVIAFSCSVISTLVDVLYPGTFSISTYRAAGIFENPNQAAFTMILFLAALLRWREKTLNLTDMILGSICGIGVFFTLSRGGFILYFVIVLLYWLNLKSKERSYSTLKGLIFLIGLGSVVVLLLPDYISRLEILQFKSERLGWFMGNFEDAFSIKDSRFALLEEYLPIIAANPLWGYGSGYIGSMWLGPHNIYLARWVDNGIFGLLSYLWLLIAVMLINKWTKNFKGVAIVVLIMVFGFLSHNLLDDRSILLIISILTTRAIAKQIIDVGEKETVKGN